MLRKLFKLSLLGVLGGALIFVLMTRQSLINGMTNRYFAGNPAMMDHLHLRTLYGSMIVYGYFLYPEASEALRMLMFSSGKDFQIKSELFYNHPDIKEALRQGKTKIMYGATQKWKSEHPEYHYPKRIEHRLFFVFNPLYLDVKNSIGWFAPYYYSSNERIYTDFDLPGKYFDFRLKDALMHKAARGQGGKVWFNYNPDLAQK